MSVHGPDPERIGPETKAYRVDLANRKKAKGSHPCKIPTPLGDPCSFHYFDKKWQANAHMQSKYHNLEDGDERLYTVVQKKPMTGEFLCMWKEGTCIELSEP